MLVDRQNMFAFNVAKLINYAIDCGYKVSLGEAFRTQEQAALYAKSGIGIVNSQHCKRLAIDLNLFDEHNNYLTDASHYEKLGIYWESLSGFNRAGYKFPKGDANHYEMRD